MSIENLPTILIRRRSRARLRHDLLRRAAQRLIRAVVHARPRHGSSGGEQTASAGVLNARTT